MRLPPEPQLDGHGLRIAEALRRTTRFLIHEPGALPWHRLGSLPAGPSAVNSSIMNHWRLDDLGWR